MLNLQSPWLMAVMTGLPSGEFFCLTLVQPGGYKSSAVEVPRRCLRLDGMLKIGNKA